MSALPPISHICCSGDPSRPRKSRFGASVVPSDDHLPPPPPASAPAPAPTPHDPSTTTTATTTTGGEAPARKKRKRWGEANAEPVVAPVALGTGAMPNMYAMPSPFPSHPHTNAGLSDALADLYGRATYTPDYSTETQAMRQSRKVYVGNLPPQISVNDLVNFVAESFLRILPAGDLLRISGNAMPILNGMVSTDKGARVQNKSNPRYVIGWMR